MSARFARGSLIAGKYRLVRQVGEGAMGTVWVAHNELLDVRVAIKVLRVDSRKTDPDRLYRRLLQEARAAARLGHPAIVRIFDFGRASEGSPFIVMELLEGESLADVLEREHHLDPVRAVQMMLPIADALATAHGRGIVHRDIKPENIFIAKDEYDRLQPKLVDFGVARFAEEGRTMTCSGALMGTPDYMAPEQARGDNDIDHRVDIWALCIVLYELMTGRRPFASDAHNYLAVLRAIASEEVAPIHRYGVGDAALWVILERGLRKRRADRWDTMRVLGEALALWLYERGVREDAYGASLKTTWLQSGIDGVKIETPSMSPPPMLDSADPGSSDETVTSGLWPALPPADEEQDLDSCASSEPPAEAVTVDAPAPGVNVRSDPPDGRPPPRQSTAVRSSTAAANAAADGAYRRSAGDAPELSSPPEPRRRRAAVALVGAVLLLAGGFLLVQVASGGGGAADQLEETADSPPQIPIPPPASAVVDPASHQIVSGGHASAELVTGEDGAGEGAADVPVSGASSPDEVQEPPSTPSRARARHARKPRTFRASSGGTAKKPLPPPNGYDFGF